MDRILGAMHAAGTEESTLSGRSALAGHSIGRLVVILFVILAAASWAALLYLGRGVTFFQDEWRFVDVAGPFGTADDLFRPHNEHWSTLPFLLYRAIFNVFGLSTYLPYLAVLLALHVAAAAALFVLLFRRNGPLVAIGGAALALWVGTGYQNLFWAFQIGFVGSTAAGLWALVAFEGEGRRSSVAGTLLLLAAIMSSGIGLVFGAAVAVELVADPVRRRRVVWLVPVGVVYATWYLAVGRSGVSDARDPFSLTAVADVPGFVWAGVRNSVEATIGPLPVIVPALTLVLLAVSLVWLVGRRVSPRTLGAVTGLVVLFGLIGLVRGHLGVEQTTRSRYLYEGVFLVLLAVSGLIGSRLSPDEIRQRPIGTALTAGCVLLLLAGLVHNANWLELGRRDWLNRAGETRAYIALLDVVPPALVNREVAVDWNIPDPPRMRRLIASYGDPARDVLVPTVVRPPSARDEDRALFRLVGGNFTIRPDGSEGGGRAPQVVRSSGGTVGPAGECVRAVPDLRRASVTVHLPDRGALRLSSVAPATGRAFLQRTSDDPQQQNGLDLPFGPEGAVIGVPALDGDGWLVTVHLPDAAGEVTLCEVDPQTDATAPGRGFSSAR